MMRIGELAERLGTTSHAIRFYERRGLVPATGRNANGYREYGDRDVARLRMLIGLRSLDLPLYQAAALASLCSEGKCDQMSEELRAVIQTKRAEIARRADELRYLDQRLAHLAGELESGRLPRRLIKLGKEVLHAY